MSAKIILTNLVVVSLIGLSFGQAWSSPFYKYLGAFGTSTYHLSEGLFVSWDEAYLLCKERGMSLLNPTSQAEFNAVTGMLQTLKNTDASYFDRYIAFDGMMPGSVAFTPYSEWIKTTNWFSYATRARLPFTWTWGPASPGYENVYTCLSFNPTFLTVSTIFCGTHTAAYRYICKRTGSSG